jgi:protein-S-isoprenylcysteine O-methyltransferase Ste14
MADDQLFRLVLLAGCVLLLPIGIYHRLKARTDEKLDRRQEGWFILISLRLTGIAGWAGLMTYLINPSWMSWAAVPAPRWLRWIGVSLFAVTGCLFLWTFRSLGKNLTDTVVTRQEHTLVTVGPYRWVRHPLYLAAALATLAVPLASANAFIFVSGCVILLLLAVRTRREEVNLIARFGDDYRNYMRRTGRFLPRLK